MLIVAAGKSAQLSDCPVVESSRELVKVVKDQTVDVVLLPEDFDVSSWIGDQIQNIIKAAPLADVIVLGNQLDGALIFELLEAGARSYLFRDDNPSVHIEAALRAVKNGKIYLSPTANAEYLKATQSGCWEWWLTPQTRTVLRLIAEGQTVPAIASELHLKTWTVYKLLKRIRLRFDVNTNAAAVSRAIALGYVRFNSEVPQ